ncbi:MAG TPA: hypothetical protein VK797_00010 [Tepidisphaeraceae bacterium]|jgi:hypothetical protein|nr:hypothetical protein [Tepidisphaeraceae bacterium]
MFPLAGKGYPRSVEELASALVTAMEQVLRFPQRDKVVVVSGGGTYPALDRVKIDLTDATVVTETLTPRPEPAGTGAAGITVASLDVVGQPIRHQAAKVNFALHARGLSFDFARDADGAPMLLLKEAEAGEVEVDVSRQDLQSLVAAATAMAVKPHGVTIQDLAVSLTNLGPQTLQAEVRVKAKKAFVSGTLLLRGRVDIDDELIATLSNVAVSGDGMIGKLAAGALKGKLAGIEGEKVPLTTFSLGDVRLHDLKVSTENGLHVNAVFGSRS